MKQRNQGTIKHDDVDTKTKSALARCRKPNNLGFHSLTIRLLCISSLLCLSQSALAGIEEALSAYGSKDYGTAATEAEVAASKGDPRAYFLLGVMNQHGLGKVADPREAARLYERAAQGGIREAYTRLAQLHARGVGVSRNQDAALQYARQAAKRHSMVARMPSAPRAMLLELCRSASHCGDQASGSDLRRPNCRSSWPSSVFKVLKLN